MTTNYPVPYRSDEDHCWTWHFTHLNFIAKKMFQKRMLTRSEKVIYAER